MSVLLLSDWSKTSKTLPESYILPPNKRPEDAEISNDIPVIDLSQGTGEGKLKLLQQIIQASRDYGLFQVINHGVPENLMDDAMTLGKGFFELPAEEKAKLYSHDESKKCRLCSGKFSLSEGGTKSWRDMLQHPCHPLEDHIQSWPDKPLIYREVIGAYSVEVRKLGLKILDLMSEGLGLELGYFKDELTKDQTLVINHYPPCPDPSLTIGVGGHCDPNLLTILQQEVYGLQIIKDDKWIGIKPLPHAFVISLSTQLEVISNGKLKSARHRVVTNAEGARTSLINFISPSLECIIEPAKGLANEPTKFKTFKYKDFFEGYMTEAKRLETGGAGTDDDLMEPLELFKL